MYLVTSPKWAETEAKRDKSRHNLYQLRAGQNQMEEASLLAK